MKESHHRRVSDKKAEVGEIVVAVIMCFVAVVSVPYIDKWIIG